MMYQWLFQNLPKAYSMICCWKRAPPPLARQPRSHLSGRAADRWGGRRRARDGLTGLRAAAGLVDLPRTYAAASTLAPHSPHTTTPPPRRRRRRRRRCRRCVVVAGAAAAAVAP
jgi:hypothetical protein